MREEDEKKYDGVVIWYNEHRGYGFVRFDKDEIFSSLNEFSPSLRNLIKRTSASDVNMLENPIPELSRNISNCSHNSVFELDRQDYLMPQRQTQLLLQGQKMSSDGLYESTKNVSLVGTQPCANFINPAKMNSGQPELIGTDEILYEPIGREINPYTSKIDVKIQIPEKESNNTPTNYSLKPEDPNLLAEKY